MWVFRNFLLPRMHRDMSRYIDRAGDYLQYVRHVRIVTDWTAFILFSQSHDGGSHPWHRASMLLWGSLSNVSCVTLTAEKNIAEKRIASVADRDAKGSLVVEFNYLRHDLRQEETRTWMRSALPRLQDVRCEVFFVCIRLRVSQDNRWSHWYAGDEFPHAPGDTESIREYDWRRPPDRCLLACGARDVGLPSKQTKSVGVE